MATTRREALWMIAAAGGQGQTGGEGRGGPAPDLVGEMTPTGADTGSLYPFIEKLAARREFTHSFLNPRYRTVEQFRREGRAVLEQALGGETAKVPLAPEVVHREDLGDVVREKVVFSTTAEFRVPAYLHLPKTGKRPLPAIVDLHSHGGMFLYGKEKVIDFGAGNHPVLREYHERNYGGRPTATALARRGYVVLTIDAFPFGERRLMMDEDLQQGWDRWRYSREELLRMNQRCRQKESTIVKALAYAGLTWPGIVAWDDMRSVDYLVSRPEVDARRIGCVGVSLGGYRSLLLAGLDDRIAAACVTGFMSTVRPMIRRHMDTHSFVHFIPRVHAALDLPDVVGLRAPKPLLVQQCRKDGLFPLEGMEAAVGKLEAIYRKAGARENFEARYYDLPHVFNVAMQEEAFGFFDRVLRG